jgi:hypothetical protein
MLYHAIRLSESASLLSSLKAFRKGVLMRLASNQIAISYILNQQNKNTNKSRQLQKLMVATFLIRLRMLATTVVGVEKCHMTIVVSNIRGRYFVME